MDGPMSLVPAQDRTADPSHGRGPYCGVAWHGECSVSGLARGALQQLHGLRGRGR